MNKYHLKITDNETNEIIKEIDFNAIFMGYGSDDDNGYTAVVHATPIECAVVISTARAGMNQFVKEHEETALFVKFAELSIKLEEKDGENNDDE